MQRAINHILSPANKITMSEGLYSPVMKNKLNPQFIGIAHKLSSSKQKRQQIEHQRNSILRTLKFKMSLDLGLDKSLEEQQARLRDVRSVYQRRLADQEFKREQQHKKRKKLRNLSTSVRQRRENLKFNIKDSLDQVHTRNRNLHEWEKELSYIFQSRVKQDDEQRVRNNRIKYKQVKLMEKQSQDVVNRHYRALNKQSLNNYKHWITEEAAKTGQFVQEIQKMESEVLRVDAQIEKKKNKIINIFSEIENYTSETLDVQSRCLPSCLRSNLSLSLQSSKLKDLLLKGTKQILEKY